VALLIKPGLDVGDVSQFLWEHICCDTEVLVNAVGKSLDDCVLLMNLLMCQFIDVLPATGLFSDVSCKMSHPVAALTYCYIFRSVHT